MRGEGYRRVLEVRDVDRLVLEGLVRVPEGARVLDDRRLIFDHPLVD